MSTERQRELWRKASKKYQTCHREEIKARNKAYTESHKEDIRAYRAGRRKEEGLRWNKKNPAKRRAYKKLLRAVQTGRITRPKSCSSCGKNGRIHGHHLNYSRPLNVVWLCPACHRATHGEMYQ